MIRRRIGRKTKRRKQEKGMTEQKGGGGGGRRRRIKKIRKWTEGGEKVMEIGE